MVMLSFIFRFTGCTFTYEDEHKDYDPRIPLSASEILYGRLLNFMYSPPKFAKRCQIKIDFDTYECKVLLRNVNQNDSGKWALYLDYQIKEPIILIVSGSNPEDELWYDCNHTTNSTIQNHISEEL